MRHYSIAPGSKDMIPALMPASIRLAAEKADRTDYEWFLAHPDRSYRMRRVMGRETPYVRDYEIIFGWMVVRKIAPDVRSKLCFRPQNDAPPPDDEQLAHAYFDAIIEGAAGDRFGAALKRVNRRYAELLAQAEGAS